MAEAEVLVNSSPPACQKCSESCRVVPLTEKGVERVDSVICTNPDCEWGPPAPVNQLDLETPHSEVAFFPDGSTGYRVVGSPSQGEANVPRVAYVFMEVGNRDLDLAATHFRMVGVTETTAERKLCEHELQPSEARTEEPHDCELLNSEHEVVRRLQVTRAPLNDVFRELAKTGKAERRYSFNDACRLLVEAIRKKQLSATPGIDLVVDAIDAGQLAFLADSVVARENAAWLSGQDWRAVWVVGPGWLRRLDATEVS